jgi:ATP-dependent exoDNAse (exonuclease V) beta subunit
MEKTLNLYQKEEKKMLIGQFNEKISEVVKDFDTPFIYERIGEKYRHFFIDEFQDTSKLQWDNLKPLLNHALDTLDINGNSGSVFLVGDPKQAIYRWRGGDVHMFLELLRDKKFNQMNISTSVLPKNYRSLDNLVRFNNEFIKEALESITDLKYRSFYQESFFQKNNNSSGGKVEIHFTQEKMDSIHIQKTIDALLCSRKKGFSWGSMAVLVRKKKQAISVFEAISSTKIPIVSTESLLLNKSLSIKLILSVLKLHLQPENSIERINICRYFLERNNENKDNHTILKESLEGSLTDFTDFLSLKFGVSFKTEAIQNSNFYELIENLISSLGLLNEFDTYLEFFLNYCHDFSIKSKNNIYNFIKKWENDSEKLTIPMPEDNEAVRIMTIHVAKGLEFPVVILPFLYSDFQPNSSIKRQTWYPIKYNQTNIDYGRINFSSRLENYGLEGKKISDNDKLENELDAFNTLYVALTRASHKMVIITTLFDKKKNKKIMLNYLLTLF